MTSTDLKVLLLRKGVKQTEIARSIGTKPSIVCRVIQGKERSKRVEKAIAILLNKNTNDIWPLVA